MTTNSPSPALGRVNSIFEFEGSDIRIVKRDGEPWFVAADVCKVLDVKNSRDAVARLDEDERGVVLTDTLGGAQKLTVMSESGLYALILTSRDATKPGSIAHRFRKWVTAEVLPSLRKDGHYGEPKGGYRPTMAELVDVMRDPANAIHLVGYYAKEVLERDKVIKAQAPKVEAYDRISAADGTYCLTNAAKVLQMQPRKFIATLHQNGWIYKRPGSRHWIAYQSKIQFGFLEVKQSEHTGDDGITRVHEQVRVTAKGIARLAKDMSVDISGTPQIEAKPIDDARLL